MESITAKEFFLNTFETDFLTDEEKGTIITAMQLFAKGKCREQRAICLEQIPPKWKESFQDNILNAPEPEY